MAYDWLLDWGRRLFEKSKDRQVEGLTVVHQVGGDGTTPVTAYLTRDTDDLLDEVHLGKTRHG